MSTGENDLRLTSLQGHILLETLPGGNDSSMRLAQIIAYCDIFVVWPIRFFRVKSRDVDLKWGMIHNKGSSSSSIMNTLGERIYYMKA